MKLSILYRGPLSSCNYGCTYCPFALRENTEAELSEDRAALQRFVNWLCDRPATDELGLLFTPWGEALVRPWYREALVQLSRLPQVRRVAVQTNLSAPLNGWLERCDPSSLGIWATYHPGFSNRTRFVARIRTLQEAGVSVSAGVVGFEKHREEIEQLSAALPKEVYLWINAPKSTEPVRPAHLSAMERIDPLFAINAQYHESLGEWCDAGYASVSVSGDGTVRRCHFLASPIANLYDGSLDRALKPRRCTATHCGCHIGYVNLRKLGLQERFGAGLLERNPRLKVLGV